MFYRGLHCPICERELSDLQRKLPAVAERTAGLIAISSDDETRATEPKAGRGVYALRLGYGLDLPTARKRGLLVSTVAAKPRSASKRRRLCRSPLFNRPDGTLCFGSVQTMPFARAHFVDIRSAINMVVAKNYPTRGEVAELSRAAA